MKIFNYKNNHLMKLENLYKGIMIDIKRKYIISFVGAGGKTTLIFNLAEELKKLGKKVIITTTTNMFICEKYFLPTNDLTEIKRNLDIHSITVIGKPVNNKKFTALENINYNELLALCDFVLIESDGSKRLPLKVPAYYEPVIADGTDIIVGVSGIDSIGKTINEACHRKELVCSFFNTDEEHIISENDIAKILSDGNGTMKGLRELDEKRVSEGKGKVTYVAVINKCDTDEFLKRGEIIGALLEEKKINNLITSFKE